MGSSATFEMEMETGGVSLSRDEIALLKSRRNKAWLVVFLEAAVIFILLAILLASLGGSHSPSTPPASSTPAAETIGTPLSTAMDVQKLMGHLEDLYAIAMQHNGSRAVHLGYNASAEYVRSTLNAALDVVPMVQHFSFDSTVQDSDPVFQQRGPPHITYLPDSEFRPLTGSGSGNVTAQAAGVAGLGCTAADFAGFPSGHAAIIKRGNCTFQLKVDLAAEAGAVAVLIFNDAASDERVGVFGGTLSAPVPFPVFGTSHALGGALWGSGATLTFVGFSHTSLTFTSNTCIDSPGGDPRSVIVVGAHLDSVAAGPGINDNGSGSSLLLQMALQFFRLGYSEDTVNKVRFCWWGAEELGLLGSEYYVSHLKATDAESFADLALNLNFDMVASPNYVRGVYAPIPGDPVGSQPIERLFHKSLESRGLSHSRSEFNGRSDYGPFIEEDIPAGGLDTGAEVVKTVEEQKMYGGVAHAAYDPCYHQKCDTLDNISQDALIQQAQAAADVLYWLAFQPDLRAFLGTERVVGDRSGGRRRSMHPVPDHHAKARFFNKG